MNLAQIRTLGAVLQPDEPPVAITDEPPVAITLQIGNSDDKLTQAEWSKFVRSVGDVLDSYADDVHFSGVSSGLEPWQNAAWVFVASPHYANIIRQAVVDIRGTYQQDSVAWTEGVTQFI